ncbi:hypothetical protein ACHWQZ_G003695 [Mnemiopsis leidyi]
MTNADGKSNKSNKTNTRQAGRKKVIKSPVKTSSTQNEGEDDKNYCPCKEYMDGELSVGCENCGEYWHLCCVGLKGLTMEMVGLLENWQCQDCYVCPYSYKEKVAAASSTSDCGTMRVMVRDELHAIQPVIKVTVENVVRNLLTKSACSKDDLKEVVKSYADVTKECQKEIVKEAAMTQSSKTVVENVVRKLDADKVEREKRRTNVVVLKAPEPKKDSTTDQKKSEDMEFCRNVLKIPSKDLDTCWRAGKIDNTKPDYSRPLIIKLKNEGLVQEWTKDGKGYRTDSGHWINKDLCAADRKSSFLAREERRKRMEKKN